MKYFLQISFSLLLLIFPYDSYSQTQPEPNPTALYQNFLDNRKGSVGQKKIAYENAKEFLKVTCDLSFCGEICDFVQFWIDKYEISLKTQFDVTDWRLVKNCGITFFAPKDLKDLKAQGIDSCVRELEDENIKIAIDVGNFEGKFTKNDKFLEYKEEMVEIDGQKAQSVTFIDNNEYVVKRGNRKFVAGVHIEINETESKKRYYNIAILGKSEKDLETARQIFKTIKFQKNPIVNPIEIN